MKNRKEIDSYYRRNVFGISGAEFLWGLGLPVVVESTFLQLFLKNLGASSFAIGLIPAFFFVGCSVFSLVSSYLTNHLPGKRASVVALHMISSISLFLFGAALYLFGEIPYLLAIFFSSYAVFSICIGMTVPVWLNFLVKIFTEDRSVPALACMMICQNFAKLASSLLLVKVVEKHAFSLETSGIIFISVGAVFFTGSLFFLFCRESEAEVVETGPRTGFLRYILETVRHILGNRNFLLFLAGDLEFFVVVTVIAFYANYATTYCGIALSAAAGMFVACIYTGAILVNVALGSLGFLSLKGKYILSKILSLSALALLVFFCSYTGFYLASFLLGASRGTRMIVYAPSVKKLSGLADATSYYAVAPLLALPLTASLPLLTGRFLDAFSHLGADAYRIVFLAAALLVAGSLFCMLKTDYSKPAGHRGFGREKANRI